MLSISILHGRTASMKELRVATLTKTGTNEQFEKKTVDFRFAVPRNASPVKVVKDGKETTEVPTDFFYCQANDKIAERLIEQCLVGGKFVSREFILSGHFEIFTVDRVVEGTQKTKIDGRIYEVPVKMTVPQEVHKFVVERLDFCGPKPANGVTEAKAVEASEDEIPEAKALDASATTAVVNDSFPDDAMNIPEAPVVPSGYNGTVTPF